MDSSPHVREVAGATRFARRRRWSVAVLTIAAAAGGGAWVAAERGGGPSSAIAQTSEQVATSLVARRTLVDRQSLDGKLGYGALSTLPGRIPGTVTWLPREGKVVGRGATLYRVDGTPVQLFYGTTPAWRALAAGMSDGVDVTQLERNLIALGYDPGRDITADDHFDWATRAAVKRWQEDVGLSETGVVDFGRVVFARGAQRVGKVQATAGAAALGPLLQLSATRRVVTSSIDAGQQTLIHVGEAVVVDLPNGAAVAGRISSISRVAQPAKDTGGATIAFSIAFARRTRLPALDQAPVTIKIARERKANALSVPVTALLAQPGGRYSVEVVAGKARRFVPVRLGLFANGFVAVSGTGLRPGLKVVVAQ
jgi:peptidoglycan hydrolase-like protein with peptidoglycan-binding domain